MGQHLASDPSTLVTIALIFVVAGLVKGALGLGLPTIGMGLLSLVIPPAAAATLVFLPSLATNVWQGLDGRATAQLLRRLAPMLTASFAATLAFSHILALGATQTAAFWLGVALLAYGLLGLTNRRLEMPPAAEPWTGIAAGLATGFVTGATGVFVLPAVPYIAGLDLDRNRLVQAMGMSFTVSTLALGLGLWMHGAFSAGATWASALALLPALAGMRLGATLRGRISAAAFRKLFFLLLMALGAYGVLRAI